MPEPSQYTFTPREVLTTMVKTAGLHSGKWQLIVQFSMQGINAGVNNADPVPAALVMVSAFGLQKAEETSPPSLVVDASEVNPVTTA